MKLIHFSQEEISSLKEEEYDQNDLHWHAKPNGLWVSDESQEGWRQWSLDNDFCLERLKFSYEVLLKDDANILYLKSPNEIFDLAKKYPFKERGFGLESYCGEINWYEVKKEYQGIIITPYQWACRMPIESGWYYGWDCASGCIWDLSCIKEFNQISLPEAANKESKAYVEVFYG